MVGARGISAAGASRRASVVGAGARGFKTNPHVEVSSGRKKTLKSKSLSSRCCTLLVNSNVRINSNRSKYKNNYNYKYSWTTIIIEH